MVKFQSVWNDTFIKLIRETMHKSLFTIHREFRIALSFIASTPYPASVDVNFNLGEETLNSGRETLRRMYYTWEGLRLSMYRYYMAEFHALIISYPGSGVSRKWGT